MCPASAQAWAASSLYSPSRAYICHAPPPHFPASDHVELAKRRVRENFAFVGLVEAWDSTICLFHRQFGGAMHLNEYANLRPADPDQYKDKFRLASVEDMRELTIEDDPYDYEVYQLARQLFVERLKKYGLSVPPQLENPPDIWS